MSDREKLRVDVEGGKSPSQRSLLAKRRNEGKREDALGSGQKKRKLGSQGFVPCARRATGIGLSRWGGKNEKGRALPKIRRKKAGNSALFLNS